MNCFICGIWFPLESYVIRFYNIWGTPFYKCPYCGFKN